MMGKKMQALSSRIPPVRAATVASDLYKPHACLREELYLKRTHLGNRAFRQAVSTSQNEK